MKNFRVWVSCDEDGTLKMWYPHHILHWRIGQVGFEEAVKEIELGWKLECHEEGKGIFYRAEQYRDPNCSKLIGYWDSHSQEGFPICEEDLPRMIRPSWNDPYPIEVEVNLRPLKK